MKILLADSDPFSRLMIAPFVNASGHEVVVAEDGMQAWELLQKEDAPPIVIVDSALPKMNGVEICHRIRQQSGQQSPYLLMMVPPRSGLAEAFDAGADDFVEKPLDPVLVSARLKIAFRITELQERCARALEPETDRDPLTGAWSRRTILDFLRAQFSRSTRDGISLAVILGDMDNFYATNAKHGHDACDAVLRESARRIKTSMRPYDSLGRYGGEEFLIIAPDCTMSNAQTIAERFRALISDQLFEAAGKKIQASISFGIATTAETGAMDEEGMLRCADSALLAAKENGRNRVEIARRVPRHRAPQPRQAPPAKAKELVQ